MHEIVQQPSASATIHALAAQHCVAYVQTTMDVLGSDITRLSGDDVALDKTELLLLALERAGCIDPVDAVLLHARYLRQAQP